MNLSEMNREPILRQNFFENNSIKVRRYLKRRPSHLDIMDMDLPVEKLIGYVQHRLDKTDHEKIERALKKNPEYYDIIGEIEWFLHDKKMSEDELLELLSNVKKDVGQKLFEDLGIKQKSEEQSILTEKIESIIKKVRKLFNYCQGDFITSIFLKRCAYGGLLLLLGGVLLFRISQPENSNYHLSAEQAEKNSTHDILETRNSDNNINSSPRLAEHPSEHPVTPISSPEHISQVNHTPNSTERIGSPPIEDLISQKSGIDPREKIYEIDKEKYLGDNRLSKVSLPNLYLDYYKPSIFLISKDSIGNSIQTIKEYLTNCDTPYEVLVQRNKIKFASLFPKDKINRTLVSIKNIKKLNLKKEMQLDCKIDLDSGFTNLVFSHDLGLKNKSSLNSFQPAFSKSDAVTLDGNSSPKLFRGVDALNPLDLAMEEERRIFSNYLDSLEYYKEKFIMIPYCNTINLQDSLKQLSKYGNTEQLIQTYKKIISIQEEILNTSIPEITKINYALTEFFPSSDLQIRYVPSSEFITKHLIPDLTNSLVGLSEVYMKKNKKILAEKTIKKAKKICPSM